MKKILILTIVAIMSFTASITLADTPQWLDLTVCETINNNLSYCMGTVDYARSRVLEGKLDDIMNDVTRVKFVPVKIVVKKTGYSILVRDNVPIGEGKYCYVSDKGSVYCK